MRNHDGFTLIELMVVITIIGILAAIAIPDFTHYRDKAYLSEGYVLSSFVRQDVLAYYDHTGTFPKNNLELGFPDEIKGKYVKSIKVIDGSIEITYNQQIKSDTQAVITLYPVVNETYPTGPVTWDERRSF